MKLGHILESAFQVRNQSGRAYIEIEETQTTQVDGHTAVGGAGGKVAVTSSPDGNIPALADLVPIEGLDSKGYLLSCLGLQDALGSELPAVAGVVGLDGLGVLGILGVVQLVAKTSLVKQAALQEECV